VRAEIARHPDRFERLGNDQALAGPGRPSRRYRLRDPEAVRRELRDTQELATVPAVEQAVLPQDEDDLLTLESAELSLARALGAGDVRGRQALAEMATIDASRALMSAASEPHVLRVLVDLAQQYRRSPPIAIVTANDETVDDVMTGLSAPECERPNVGRRRACCGRAAGAQVETAAVRRKQQASGATPASVARCRLGVNATLGAAPTTLTEPRHTGRRVSPHACTLAPTRSAFEGAGRFGRNPWCAPPRSVWCPTSRRTARLRVLRASFSLATGARGGLRAREPNLAACRPNAGLRTRA
jgi:hypothetical protein